MGPVAFSPRKIEFSEVESLKCYFMHSSRIVCTTITINHYQPAIGNIFLSAPALLSLIDRTGIPHRRFFCINPPSEAKYFDLYPLNPISILI